MIPGSATFSRWPVFVQNVSAMLATQVAGVAIAMGYNILIARATGPEGKGLYSLALLVPAIIYTLTSLNLNNAAVYFLGKREIRPSAVVGNTLIVSMALAVLGAAAFLSALPFLTGSVLKNIPLRYLAVSCTIYPAMMMGMAYYGVLAGFQNIKTNARIELLRNTMLFILIALALRYYGIGGAITAAACVAWIVLGIYALKVHRAQPVTLKPDTFVIRQLISYGVKGHIGSIVQLFNYRLDVLLINFFLTTANVGLYTVAVMIAEILWYIPNSIGYVLFSKVSSQQGTADGRTMTPLVCRVMILLTVTAGLCLWAVSGPLIAVLFGPRFSSSAHLLNILIPGVIALGITKVLGNDLAGRGKPEFATLTAVITLACTVMLNFALIPLFGIAGAASATAVSYGVSAVTIIILFRRLTRIPVAEILIPRPADVRLCLSLFTGRGMP